MTHTAIYAWINRILDEEKAPAMAYIAPEKAIHVPRWPPEPVRGPKPPSRLMQKET